MLKGIDVSHWNGEGNWNITKEKEIDFAVVRLGSIEHSSGNCYTDYLLEEHTAGAASVGIPLSYYFYFRPYHDALKQANFVGDTLKNLPLELDFWLDVETAAYAIGGKPANEVARDNIKLFIDKLYNLGFETGIYTRQSFWDINVAQDSLWSRLKLWAARYNAELVSPWGDGRYIFRDWSNWNYWQYSSTNGLAKYYGFPGNPSYFDGMDLNYYNGDKQEFNKEYGFSSDILQQIIEQLDSIDSRLTLVENKIIAIESSLNDLLDWSRNINYKK